MGDRLTTTDHYEPPRGPEPTPRYDPLKSLSLSGEWPLIKGLCAHAYKFGRLTKGRLKTTIGGIPFWLSPVVVDYDSMYVVFLLEGKGWMVEVRVILPPKVVQRDRGWERHQKCWGDLHCADGVGAQSSFQWVKEARKKPAWPFGSTGYTDHHQYDFELIWPLLMCQGEPYITVWQVRGPDLAPRIPSEQCLKDLTLAKMFCEWSEYAP